MQKVQIYIGSDRLDLFKDETITLTQSLKNIKDISRTFTDFTQTFSVPASSTNNKVFQHYYNFDIVDGFDARSKVAGSIELNYTPFKTGLVRLDGVDIKNNKAYAYRITFFGETINLKDILGENQLDSLQSLDTYNTTYQASTVIAAMQVDPDTTDLVAPLISHTNRIFYDSSGTPSSGTNNMRYVAATNAGVLWSDLKYALRIAKIIDAIETDYLVPSGLSFSDDFFTSSNLAYNGLFLWLHRKSGAVETATIGTNQLSLPISTWTPTSGTTLTNNGTTISIGDLFTVAPFAAITTFNVLFVPTDTSKEYRFVVNRNSAEFFSSGDVTGTLSLTVSDFDPFLSGGYTFILRSNEQVTFSTATLQIGGYYYNPATSSTVTYTDNYSATGSGNIIIPTSMPFIIKEQIPEMKIIDFLTGLFKMFNLVAYYEDSKIVVKTYNDYFVSLDEGLWNTQETEWQDDLRLWNEIGSTTSSVYSIDEFLDTNSSQVNVGLPYKQINFSYEGTGTLLAKKYNQLNNIGWGEIRYTLDGQIYDAPSDVYNVKLPFEHIMMERLNDVSNNDQTKIMYGFYVNENEQPYIGNPLLFYPIKQNQSFGLVTSVSVRNDSTNQALTNIILPSNSQSLSSTVSTQNINFQNEINEFSLDTTFFNTLFQGYYNTIISESFNTKRRFVKVKSFLPLNILYNLKLNNLIEISDQNYKINTMTSNFQTGETTFELINTL